MNKDIIKIDLVGTEVEESSNEFLELIDDITENESLKLSDIKKLLEAAEKIYISIEKLQNIDAIKQYIDATEPKEIKKEM